MKKKTNILISESLKWMSLILSIALCFNLSIINEEEVRETEKDSEIEVVYQFSKLTIDEIEFIKSFEKLFYKNPVLNFHSRKINHIPFLNFKLYIFHCQLALKSCVSNNF